MDEEGLFAPVAALVLAQPFDRAQGDIAGRVQLLGQTGAPGVEHVWHLSRQRVGATAQARRVRALRAQPALIVAAHLVAMLEAQLHVVEAVVRQAQPVRRVGPARHRLLTVGVIVAQVGQGLGLWAVRPAPPRRRSGGHWLEMGLADERGLPARLAQLVDEGPRLQGQRHPVHPHPCG